MTNVLRNPVEDLIRARAFLLRSTESNIVEGTNAEGTTTTTTVITNKLLFIRSKEQGASNNGISVEYKDGVFIVRGPKPLGNYSLKTISDGKVTFCKVLTSEKITLKFDGFNFTNGTITVKPNKLYKSADFMVNIQSGKIPFSTDDVLMIGSKQEVEQYKVSTVAELRAKCTEKSKFIELPERNIDVHDEKSDGDDAAYKDADLVNFPETFLSGGAGLTIEKPVMPTTGWLQPVRRIINREDADGKPVMQPTTYWWVSTGETTGYWSTTLPKIWAT